MMHQLRKMALNETPVWKPDLVSLRETQQHTHIMDTVHEIATHYFFKSIKSQ